VTTLEGRTSLSERWFAEHVDHQREQHQQQKQQQSGSNAQYQHSVVTCYITKQKKINVQL